MAQVITVFRNRLLDGARTELAAHAVELRQSAEAGDRAFDLADRARAAAGDGVLEQPHLLVSHSKVIMRGDVVITEELPRGTDMA